MLVRTGVETTAIECVVLGTDITEELIRLLMAGKDTFVVASIGCWTIDDNVDVHTRCPGRTEGGSVVGTTGGTGTSA